MASKAFMFVEILLLTTLFSFWTVQCDIFVDETGETEVIPIDDFLGEDVELKRSIKEPFEEKIQPGGAHPRSKRDELESENEEGSGEAYEDDKEDDEYEEEDYEDQKTKISSQPTSSTRSIPLTTSSDVTTTMPQLLTVSEDLLSSMDNASTETTVATPKAPENRPTEADAHEISSSISPIDEDSDYEFPIVESDHGRVSEPPPKYPNKESPIEENHAPYVQTKLPKYEVIAGKPFRKRIPEDTFGDEDGNTRNLKLKLKDENGFVVQNNWIGFDENSQEIYALLENENQIGRYMFNIEAIDNGGLSVTENLEIVVRQYQGSRIVSHQFSIEFDFADRSESFIKDWPWKMMEKISELYGDINPSANNSGGPKINNIVVRGLSVDPYIFIWTNDTLTQPDCPMDSIRLLYSKLVENDSLKHVKTMKGSPSKLLQSALGSQIIPKSVTLSYHGSCLNDDSLSPFDPVVVGKDAAKPVIRNPIDRINVTAGELLRFKVPEDTCWDEEDGITPMLKLQLLTTNRRELSPNAWLQFDSRNQEFIGIPLEEEVGREEYQLVCSDSNGLIALDAIVVIVQNRPFSERFGIEFSLRFKDFPGSKRDIKVKIVESLAGYFGDQTTSNIILKSFDVEEAKIVWYNKSLAYAACDDPSTKWVSHQMLMPDGKIRQRFVQHFEKYLHLLGVDAIKKGSCAIEDSIIPSPGSPRGEGRNGLGIKNTIFHGIIPSADYLLTFIIPAIIITCMLLLAILLACLLHKKRKAGKLNLFYSESLPPRVPVILQDELYEEQELGFHKQPVLLPDDSRSGLYTPQQPQEMDRLLSQQVNLDFNPATSLPRPTPAYQRRQL